ncbi:Uridylate kinase [Candidatus Westeberhardia cardiocondylae]|uniref:Uridylate kinase n=1 Tax=Candidatus Westeberhardia cardiocondylae TaxID=1594731 RepID=A0A0H5BWZ7_9ENTR|nr:UMP kinase [Candidatus Westeberhardia cardiocondylae]CEN32285.1 Uridylate kinase [Candidatus Westeberhardia cardiocondylae]
MSKNLKPIYQRIILKLSGEALQKSHESGINNKTLNYIAKEIKKLVHMHIQVGIVIGGGNLFRGKSLKKTGMNRVISDHIGILATIINGLAIQDALHKTCVNSHLMSPIPLNSICDCYNWYKAIDLLQNNNVVIFSAGIGNPFFTTDSAACVRGIEIKADIVIKATKVEGVFSEDPRKNQNATFYNQISYKDIIRKKIKIMDLTAFSLAKDHNLPICIFNFNKPGALQRIIMGDKTEGTLITNNYKVINKKHKNKYKTNS